MRYKYKYYDIKNGVKKARTKVAIGFSVLGVGVGGVIGSIAIFGAAHAANSAIYNNIPSPLPGNVVSEGPEAYAFAELGGQVQFDGTARQNPTVSVAMSSWACQEGHWYDATCVTAPGATYNYPITVNIYAVNADNSPGSQLATQTQTFTMPYRPSTDSIHCTGGRWYDGTNCFNGKAFAIDFNFSNLTLPDKAIVSVEYNTTHYGPVPMGESQPCFVSSAGCFYDSLNIGLTTSSPTTGTDPTPSSVYVNYPSASSYCDGGTGGTGFRADTGCWGGYQPTFEVTASTVMPTSKDQCMNNGWRSYGTTFKNQGDCVSFVATKGKNQPSGH